MYDFSRFCLAVIIASALATLFIGMAAWTLTLISEPTRPWIPSTYNLKIFGVLGVVVACVGCVAAALALLLSDRMFSKADTMFLTAAGAATGLAAIALITPASNIHYHLMFTAAGAIGGWTFKQVWQTAR